MKQNPFTKAIKERLEQLGLSQIPRSALTLIEFKMLAAFTHAIKAITPKLVSQCILNSAISPDKKPSSQKSNATLPKNESA